MKYLQNLAARLEEANKLSIEPACGLRRAVETYEVIQNGQSLIGEEAVVDLNLSYMKEALEALDKQREILTQLLAEANVKELLEYK